MSVPLLRSFWINRIEHAWESRSIVWLSGARRLGKTVLSRQVPKARYFNCDLPSVRERLADPESFFVQQPANSRIVLDEVHRAEDPAGLLKIAADAWPGIRVLATGSSTLHASRRFSDSLAGRKWPIRFAPVLWRECPDWVSATDLDRRLLQGGFPDQLLLPAPTRSGSRSGWTVSSPGISCRSSTSGDGAAFCGWSRRRSSITAIFWTFRPLPVTLE